MAIIKRHISPDQSLVLFVDSTAGDFTIGFEGFPWHTHGYILQAWGYADSPERNTHAFLNDILQSRHVIAVIRRAGTVSDICVPDNFVERPLSKSLTKYAPPDESIELRYWNGEPAKD